MASVYCTSGRSSRMARARIAAHTPLVTENAMNVVEGVTGVSCAVQPATTSTILRPRKYATICRPFSRPLDSSATAIARMAELRSSLSVPAMAELRSSLSVPGHGTGI